MRLLIFLSFLSGVCGISYEQLYGRLLSTYLGDTFHISAWILCSFLISIAMGSFFSLRLVRKLWLIETILGVYSLVIGLGGHELVQWLYQLMLQLLPYSTLASSVSIIVLILVPAFLSGFSVPIFSAYLSSLDEQSAFDKIYTSYNFGAFSCVLLVEFILLRSLGISSSMIILGALNLFIGIILKTKFDANSFFPQKLRMDFSFPVFALFLMSCISGWFQLQFLKFSEVIWGPFHENFSLVLSLALLGIACGSFLVNKISFSKLLIFSSFSILLSFLSFSWVIYLVGTLNDHFLIDGALKTILKFFSLMLMGGFTFVCFGASVPTLQRESKASPGFLLGVSAFGNCLGFILSVLIINANFSYLAAVAGTTALLMLCSLFWFRLQPRFMYFSGLISVLGLCLLNSLWDPQYFAFCYEELGSKKFLAFAKERNVNYVVHKKLNNSVTVSVQKNKRLYLVINGHRGLTTLTDQTDPAEMVFGMIPALYTASHEKALVLGLGSGVTAGATSSIYKHSTVVEINPIMMDLQPMFAHHNLSVHKNPSVNIVEDDGLSFLLKTKDTYDAIINTVTSPLYFSSSKLYTKEFFELAKKHLNEGGVYTLYFENQAFEKGASMIFQTLRESFKDCQVILLRHDYNQIVCSNEKLRPQAIADSRWPRKLKAKFGWLSRIRSDRKVMISDLLEAIIFPNTNLMKKSHGTIINTFDKPALEYLMASKSSYDPAMFNWRPTKLLEYDFQTTYLREKLTPDELKRRCAIIVFYSGPESYCAQILQ